jgi:divinyl protochlorophyllide a 8-vinyl-reductase
MAVASSAAAGRIGPNAIIQTLAALGERPGLSAARAALERGGLVPREALTEMVPERVFHDLVLALGEQLGATEASAILERAGALTAAYLLRARIPRPAQWLLRTLPPRPALALLLPAIERNAWTFGESGTFGYTLSPSPVISVTNRALCDTPEAAALVCRFYRGTFGALVSALASPRARLVERACQGRGDAACVYGVVW